MHGTLPNTDLKEDIRDYWSRRSQTFDLAFGHRIPQGPEFDAWATAIRERLGPKPRRVLELACGTGEVTRLLLSLGHEVTALDFSEAMLDVARKKHAGAKNLRFLLADAENPMEPDESYDAIICRHLVWTLTTPEHAFAEWYRMLRPDGMLLFFDGDWAAPTRLGRLASRAIAVLDRFIGTDPHYDGAMSDRHANIMERLPFGDGLTVDRVLPLLEATGFRDMRIGSHGAIARAQRRTADLRNKLRTLLYRRFILCCRKPV